MSSLLWVAVGVVAGLGAALVLARIGLFPVGHRQPENEPGTAGTMRVRLAPDDLEPIRGDIQGLHVVRTDLQRVGSLLERLLEETMASQPRLDPSRPEPGGSTRDAFRERARDTSPAGGSPWQQGGRSREREVQHDDRDEGFDPTPGFTAPAAAQLREPSPDAVYVQANNDAVVPSERHPPEAWLERRGGEGEVWLNPRVALTDPALQRWSTFFDWERREPGSRYQATRPAKVTWSVSGGSLVRKGVARPV